VADIPAPIWRATLKRRLIVTAAILGLWSGVIQARLVYLQVIKHEALTAEAASQQSSRQPVPGRRGEIRDRNGSVMAQSVDMPSIKADPSFIDDPVATVQALCGLLGCSAEERATLITRFGNHKSQYAPVRDYVSPEMAKRVDDLELKGVYNRLESRRYYPRRELAAHVLGYVDHEQKGVAGIEGKYNDRIRGLDGVVQVVHDRRGDPIRTRVDKAPTVGESVELTIDQYAQDVAERQLLIGIDENHAVGGSVVVMDPFSGQVLALANLPTFNPNIARQTRRDFLRNRAVQDTIEPGSAFKIVTASAALEQKVVTPDQMINVSGGRIRLGSSVVEDTHFTHDLISFTDVIVNSSNVGAIRVGQLLGRDSLSDYIKRFGFGRRMSRDFPGESWGLVHPPQKLSDGDLARVSMGYTISVTPLQLAAAVSSIANGGELIQPRVVRAWIKDGVRQEEPKVVLNRTVAPNIAAEVTAIMEGVVERGTGKQAQIDNYTVAGKTGTAAKAIQGGYSTTAYNASFVGFVPSRKPVYAIVVVLDSPRGSSYYGGAVSAPIFRRIAEQLLRHEGVPRSINAPPPVLVQRAPDAGHEVPASGPAARPFVRLPRAADSTLPDLTGLSAREALATMVRLGVTPKLHGTGGVVVDQRPASGTPLASATTVTLWLAREPRGLRPADATTQ